MRILYLPCHSILEYDQYKLWTELGHEVFSMGSYINPHKPHDNKRPPIPEGKYDDHLVTVTGTHSKDNLHEELVEPADMIIIDHIDSWISSNWDKIKHKKVVLRTIGQNTSATEFRLQQYREEGLKIVRYSPKEDSIPLYVGADAMIRFYKDPEEFDGWTGEKEKVITMGQSIKRRGEFCHWDIFDKATKGFPRLVFGAENQDIPEWGGQLEYEEMKQVFRENRVFFYTGTQPASYTLTLIETMMMGMPIVAIGAALGNSMFQNEQDTYEVDSILVNEVSGLHADTIEDLTEHVKRVLTDYSFAKRLSREGRQRAVELFGKEKIKKQWEDFFKTL